MRVSLLFIPFACFCIAAAPTSQPAAPETIALIRQFANAQRSVDSAGDSVRQSVAADPDVIQARAAFAQIRAEVMRWRQTRAGGDLTEMSKEYVAAKRAVAAAEAAAAMEERRKLMEEETALDVLRQQQQRVAHDPQQAKPPAARQAPSL
jgi:hypothetical protein